MHADAFRITPTPTAPTVFRSAKSLQETTGGEFRAYRASIRLLEGI